MFSLFFVRIRAIILSVSAALLVCITNLKAQDTIYFEDFTYADATTQGSGSPPKWTRDISKTSFSFWGTFQVDSNSMEGYYTNGEAVWLSQDINITGYTDVRIFADFWETGALENTDYIRAFYSLNGAPPVPWANFTDDFNSVSPAAGPLATGTTLKIIIRVNNNDFAIGEWHNFDNVLVTGVMPAPPVANFTSSTTITCDGYVQFTDLSQKTPTSWKWDFGDGGTDSTQNPAHTYTAPGTYTVTLIAINGLGSDTIVKNSLVTVNLGQGPLSPSCRPQTKSYCCGFGITQFSFNTINNSSADASEGFKDYTCTQETQVIAGNTYSVSVTTDKPSAHNVRVWIDFNNDGKFDGTGELVFSADNSLNASGTVLIPPTAVKNSSLRMRVAADYSYSPAPTFCDSLEYGQAEDYSVVVKPNTFPPQADFAVKDSLSCSGIIRFTDKSQNVPTSWQWDFGDGTTSLVQHPSHIYTNDSTYTVVLIAVNVYGSDTVVRTITVDLDRGPVIAACSPSTLGYCCGYGIYKITFNTINNSSPDGVEGYKDFSCSIQTTVDEGQTYPITVETGSGNPQDTRVWIDYNNDGAFDNSTELVFSSNNSYNPSGNITIPSAVFDKPLRMRVSSDYTGSGFTSCTNLTYGQAEDYTVIIKSSIPTAIHPIKKSGSLILYPNPATEFVTVSGNESNGSVSIKIENITGQTVMEEILAAKSGWMKIFNTSGFPKGVYIVRVTSGEKQEISKLVIQ